MMQELTRWYLDTLLDRASELENALGLLVGDDDRLTTIDTIRRIAHALRGSGATYGYPQITATAAAVDDAPDNDIEERTRQLIASLRTTVAQHRSPPG